MSEAEAAPERRPPSPLREIVQPFVDAARAPRALWGNNLQYLLEGFVYFGIVNYLAMYCIDDIGLSDLHAGWMVSVLTGGITFSQFLLGGLADRWGPRRGLLLSLLFLFLGRIVLAASGSAGLATGWGSPAHLLLLLAIGVILLGYGMYQPASYAIVRDVTSPKTKAMGYAMLYALMNLGGWLPTFLGPLRRSAGIRGVYWTFAALTLVTLVVTALILDRRTMERAVREARAARAGEPGAGEGQAEQPGEAGATGRSSVFEWLRNHPLADLRFSFFIFALIPVQTLFAHNWLTMPLYVERAYRGSWIGQNFEVAVNLNPLLVFILVPIVAAATRNAEVYRIMIVGTFVMAAPTFLLALGPHFLTLAGYIVIMTFGEAIWQPRFLQYAAEIAPEGRTGAYMGVAQFPWFLTKMLTGLYSGWFLARYCPAQGELDTGTMWFLYGLIALVTPVLLLLARGWMHRGLRTDV